MGHQWTTVVVDGFAAGEVDFASRLAAADQSVRDELDSKIMSPIVNAVNEGAILIVDGHADRVDTGQDHRTCLELEKAASSSRTDSAASTILTMLGRDWLDPPPTSWADLPHLAVYAYSVGASNLADNGGTEDARRRNRRVFLAVCRFTADT